jgi:hypothetical protein
MSWNHVVLVCAALAGCAEGGARPPSGFDREVRGGGLHAAPIRGITIDEVAMDDLLRSAAPLADAVVDVDPGGLDAAVTTLEAGGAPLTTVFARQAIDGVPIRGAYLYLATRPDGDGGGELVGSSYHLYQGVDVDTTPALDRAAAAAAAREALRAAPDAPVRTSTLAITPIAGELTLVWDVVLDGAEARALVTAAGPRTGRVELEDDRVFATRGTVRGWIAAGGAPGGAGTAKLVPLAEVTVRAGGAAATTGGDGRYTIDGGGAPIAVAVAGRAARVTSADRTTLAASAPAASEVDLVLGGAGGERPLAMVTALHAITRTRAFLLASDLDGDALGGPVDAIVNQPKSCNAYYLPGQRTLNFLRAGAGCRNSAEATIVAHEYGHFVDDAFGGITDDGLSEGWGDLLACLSTRQPVIGGDLRDDGRPLRSCDNRYRYPPGGDEDDPHDLGQAWAGFGWQVRKGLIAELGAAEGDARARELLLPSLVTNAPDIPAAVREVFLRDDDDHDLRDRTPHWELLLAAAERHGLAFAVEDDLVPPAAIVDLGAASVTASRIELRWTAPGDDGRRGTAARYQLRWSTAPLDEAGFARARPLPVPAPAAAGARQTTTIVVPPGASVHVALRAVDDLGNPGALSNPLKVTLAAGATLFADGAERGLGGWEATGLWHATDRWAAAGQASFWYGREASGDYDTGARTRGTLTSPVIDLAGAVAPVLVIRERIDVEGDPDHDRLTIAVADVDDPDVAIEVAKPTGWTGGFVPRLVDLGGLAGRRVRLRFAVDSVDRESNRGLGWAIDDVRVLADRVGAPPVPPPQRAARLVINEVLVDPPEGYDANRDGAWSARGDELVELVNAGDAALDLGGVTLADDAQVRLTFAAGTVLAPGRALVVFGGAAPPLAGVTTVATPGLYLNNDGDAIHVRRADGALLAELRWGAEGGRDASLTRAIDGDGESPMVLHTTRSSAPASPGTLADGRPF